jgi:hypothetical protein
VRHREVARAQQQATVRQLRDLRLVGVRAEAAAQLPVQAIVTAR